MGTRVRELIKVHKRSVKKLLKIWPICLKKTNNENGNNIVQQPILRFRFKKKIISIRQLGQARSLNMSTVGETASPAGANTNKRLYTYIRFYFACTAYVILRIHERKKRLCQHHKSTL